MITPYSDGIFYAVKNHVNPFIIETVSQIAPGRVIDLGCGAGNNLRHMIDLGWDVYAVDREKIAIDMLNEFLPSDHVFCCDLRCMDFSKLPAWNLILCNYVLQHFTRVEMTECIERINMTSRANCMMILSVFENRSDFSVDEVFLELKNLNWQLKNSEKWSRMDTSHGDPHQHEGVDSFWIKSS